MIRFYRAEKEKEIFESYGLEYNNLARVFKVDDANEEKGVILFSKTGEIFDITKGEFEDMLLKAALNHLDLEGVEQAYSFNKSIYDVLQKNRFYCEDDAMKVELKGYFDKKC